MTNNQIQQFLANIKGRTYLVDGEKATVETTSINPTTGRVMVITNKTSHFWLKGNYGFTKVFETPIKPGRVIPSVIVRPTTALATDRLDKPAKLPAKIAKKVAAAPPVTELPPIRPVKVRKRYNSGHPHLYGRVQQIMDIKNLSTHQLAVNLDYDYRKTWQLLRKCDKRITLTELTTLANALAVKLPYLVDTDPVTHDKVRLNTIK